MSCWGLKDVDDAVDRLHRRVCVQGGEDEMSRLRDGDGRGHRFQIPHFSDQDDIGILAEDVFKGIDECPGVFADLALGNKGFFVVMDEFNRVLNGHDVDMPDRIDLVDQGGQCR